MTDNRAMTGARVVVSQFVFPECLAPLEEAGFEVHAERGDAPLAHWLARIATRVGYNYWRHLGRQKTTPLPDEILEGLAHVDAESFDVQHAAELVHRLLAALPENDRLVLTMRYLEQCSITDTAYRLGWTQTRVKVQTHRAVAKLKQLAADRNIELDL